MSIQESPAYQRGVAAAKAAVANAEHDCGQLMPCGHCVHSLGHAHGCPDLTEWN